jgi:hypothetical protein
MSTLEVGGLAEHLRATGAWALSLLLALARDESLGRRPARLTEPKLGTWARFKGRLTSADLLAMVFEDAAVLHRVPFEPTAVGGDLRLERLPESLTDGWLLALQSYPLGASTLEYVVAQAKLLGVQTRVARSELHVIKPHQRVLELPGTGGQLAHYLVTSQRDLTLQANFTVACGTWREATLAGVIGLELGAPHSDFIASVEPGGLRDVKHPLRRATFEVVVGLHPDKGGMFQVEDQLAIWFPSAKIVLV